MKFSLRKNKDPLEKLLPQKTNEVRLDAIVWAIAVALTSIAWAISAYLMVREKEQAKVRLAHLEVELKRIENSSSPSH